MISYVCVGANNLEESGAFYDKLLSPLGAKRIMQTDRNIAYGAGRDKPMLVVNIPFDQETATVGNGMMVALQCKDEDQVQEVYDVAMSLGAVSEGEVALRGGIFYCGYFRDPVGNKLNAFIMKTPG